jgi:hypothetical protein
VRRNWTTATVASSRTKRVAWLVSFVVPMVLLALLLALKPAAAATGPGNQPPGSATVLEVAEPEEEGEEALEECGETEPEEEVVEETEVEAEEEPEAIEESAETCEPGDKKDGGTPPAQCLLRTARARLFAYSSHDRVRLVIRYTTFAPASVTVEYSFDGPPGSQRLGAATRRFETGGQFRVSEKLSRAEMAKVLAAKSFTVTMNIAAAPRYCQRFYTRHLTVRRTVHGQTIWFQSDSAFGTPRK